MDPERTAKKNMKFSTAAFMTGTPAQIKASRSKGDAVSMVVDIRRSTHNAVLCKERWKKCYSLTMRTAITQQIVVKRSVILQSNIILANATNHVKRYRARQQANNRKKILRRE